jgi:hypothetical protein
MQLGKPEAQVDDPANPKAMQATRTRALNPMVVTSTYSHAAENPQRWLATTVAIIKIMSALLCVEDTRRLCCPQRCCLNDGH